MYLTNVIKQVITINTSTYFQDLKIEFLCIPANTAAIIGTAIKL